MQVFFHNKYLENYAMDPAAERGRLDPTLELIRENEDFYEIKKPKKAKKKDILRAHTQSHYRRYKNRKQLYEVAMLGAGGAIETAKYAYRYKTAAFGLIRPPGHHASADSAWGFCFYNNMAISLLHLHAKRLISSAFILDFDLHRGDGNINILQSREDLKVDILNPSAPTEEQYLDIVRNKLNEISEADIIAVSAGFDQGKGDWGNLLSPDAYRKMGKWLKEKSLNLCQGRRFAILEGGYSFNRVAINFDSFCQGFADKP